MIARPATVTWQLRLRPVDSDELVRMTMTWSRREPFEVWLGFPDADVHWVVARELLAAGLAGPAGLGDVALLRDLADPRLLELILSSPDGVLGLRLPAAELADFLRATWDQEASSRS
ncbi:SsgA family sporulation/cell division regulator [Pseudonocardia acaciae]|uniref:SsgA family sporulation/cell division regulator n=1 Tax=Pseudonocardia acaciae TaxID=551276 RepID=UPI0006891B73|nr:SsgA family sporulation/cell division regulator [Pseudonocardia acaciae]